MLLRHQGAIACSWTRTRSLSFCAWSAPLSAKVGIPALLEPTDNAFIESFNGGVHRVMLNEHEFATLDHARQIIESWRIDYNARRPHKALGNRTPEEFARGLQITLPLDLSAA